MRTLKNCDDPAAPNSASCGFVDTTSRSLRSSVLWSDGNAVRSHALLLLVCEESRELPVSYATLSPKAEDGRVFRREYKRRVELQ
jgi:hypothetical protein